MKHAALAGPVAESSFGASAVALPRSGQRTRDLGELASKTIIVILFSFLAVRLAADYRMTGHVTGLLLLASEALVVVLTIFRRSAGAVDRSPQARILTTLSVCGPPLVRPIASGAIAPEAFTAMLSAVGLFIVVVGKATLGRSFGLAPANRGVVCAGPYRFMRHPIYFGYLLTHIGFALAHPAPGNLLLFLGSDIALIMRALREERTLALDPAYDEYMQRVRWHIVPHVF